MTTLTTPPLATVLTQLFQDARDTSAVLGQTMAGVSAEERARLMTSTTDYRAMYERMKDFHLAVSPETGTLLYLLARSSRARANITAAGLSDLVEIRAGDALETLARDLPEQIDLVLLDGAKALYPQVLALLEARLRPGAMIVADNADWLSGILVKSAGGGRRLPFSTICK